MWERTLAESCKAVNCDNASCRGGGSMYRIFSVPANAYRLVMDVSAWEGVAAQAILKRL